MNKQRSLNLVYESNICANSRQIMAYLINRSNTSNGTCFPSIKKISADTKLSRRTVQRKLRLLEELNFIKCEPRQAENGRYTSNLYTIIIEETVISIQTCDKESSYNEISIETLLDIDFYNYGLCDSLSDIKNESFKIDSHIIEELESKIESETISIEIANEDSMKELVHNDTLVDNLFKPYKDYMYEFDIMYSFIRKMTYLIKIERTNTWHKIKYITLTLIKNFYSSIYANIINELNMFETISARKMENIDTLYPP